MRISSKSPAMAVLFAVSLALNVVGVFKCAQLIGSRLMSDGAAANTQAVQNEVCQNSGLYVQFVKGLSYIVDTRPRGVGLMGLFRNSNSSGESCAVTNTTSYMHKSALNSFGTTLILKYYSESFERVEELNFGLENLQLICRYDLSGSCSNVFLWCGHDKIFFDNGRGNGRFYNIKPGSYVSDYICRTKDLYDLRKNTVAREWGK